MSFYSSKGLLLCCNELASVTLRNSPRNKPSPSGSGGCFASIKQVDCFALYDLTEEKRKGSMFALLASRRTTEQHARCTCSRCTTCSEVEVVSSQAYQPPLNWRA